MCLRVCIRFVILFYFISFHFISFHFVVVVFMVFSARVRTVRVRLFGRFARICEREIIIYNESKLYTLSGLFTARKGSHRSKVSSTLPSLEQTPLGEQVPT